MEFLLREEPGFGNPRSDSLLNPDDILGTPRFQNRMLGSVDLKLPIVQGSGVNPVAELVVAQRQADQRCRLGTEGRLSRVQMRSGEAHVPG